jgi:anti-sigma regulatory factor (Ser/Thr protein kinase)
MEIVRTLDGGPTAPSVARQSLDQLEGDLAPDCLDDLNLVVSELVTNAVTHSGLRDSGAITLIIRSLPGSRLRIEVINKGAGFPDTPTAPSVGHGRGLAIVQILADRWGIESDGQTRVWAELPVH